MLVAKNPPTRFSARIGVMGAIGVAVAGMAPTLAMNLNPQEPAEHVGRVIPLVFALSTLVVLLVAWCFARLAREHANAGSAYGFVSATLGPRAGLVAGWTLLGTYLAFGMVGIGAFGLFGDNLLQRIGLIHQSASFPLTILGALVIFPLSILSARRTLTILLVLEGLAVLAMLAVAAGVIYRVLNGQGPQGDPPPLRDLFIPAHGVGAQAIAMGLSFGFLSFAGFEQVATLGEEVRDARRIPQVLIGSVLGAGLVFILVTAAETLGFGTNPAGVAAFTASTSLLADLSTRYFGERAGWLLDLFAIFSALGGGLAAMFASARVLFALARDVFPSIAVARLSEKTSSPRNAALFMLAANLAGYCIMCLGFNASGSDAFFWGSTLGALALLVAYALVVLAAAKSVVDAGVRRFEILIPGCAAATIFYTLWVNIYPPQPGAYLVIPYVVAAWVAAGLLATFAFPSLIKKVRIGFSSGRTK